MQDFSKYWQSDLNKINRNLLPVFLILSSVGILLYSVVDYYLSPEHWLLFFFIRILLSLEAVVLLFLNRRKVLSNLATFYIFAIPVYIFFAFVASLLLTNVQLLIWNLSVSVAAFLWPYTLLVIRCRHIILLNSIFAIFFVLFYLMFSPIHYFDLLTYGGIFLIFSLIVSPFIGHSKYNSHYKNSKLKFDKEHINLLLAESNSKLSKMIISKDKILSVIAHDLIAPFSTLRGFSSLLIQDIKENNTGELLRDSQVIHDTLNQLYNLLQNLLKWARTKVETITWNPIQFELSGLINKVVEMNIHQSNQKEIKVSVNVKKNLFLYADQNMIETVIRNLTNNAIKFTGENGEINISAYQNENDTFISVKDTGVGIAQSQINKLFDAQLATSQLGTNKEEGVGLGLLICKDYVEVHNGKIWVESELGKGSTFGFSIPSNGENPGKQKVIPA